jgi:prepilin-type processing-associated H-X9-DG protein
MFPDDNEGKLPVNPNTGPPPAGWIRGSMGWSAGSTDNTNRAYLTDSQYAVLAPYCQSSAGIYKDPGDNIPCDLGPRVRSYSMNCMMGGYTGSAANDVMYLNQPLYRLYIKQADINRPPPVNAWVFIEEHPDCINDGFFWVKMVPPPPIISSYHWQDIPGSNHGNAGVLSFADGHAEIKPWLDQNIRNRKVQATTTAYSGFIGIDATPLHADTDLSWLQERTSALK